MENILTAGGLYAVARLLAAESLAGKKAHLYASTLTDAALAARMEELSQRHAQRFSSLLALLEE